MEWHASMSMVISAFFYSLQYLDVHSMVEDYPTWTIVFFRGVSGVVSAGVLMTVCRVEGSNTWMLHRRGVLGGLSIVCSFHALRLLNVSIASTVLATSPLWTCLMNRCFCLHQKWRRVDTLGSMVCIGGLVVLSYPGFRANNSEFQVGFVMAVLSAIFTAAVNITMREIKDQHALVLSLYSMFYCTLFGVTGFVLETMRHPIQPSTNLIQLVSTGGLSILSQSFKNYAIQHSDGLGVIVWRYLDIPFSVMWDGIVFHHLPSMMEWIGIVIIMIGCLLPLLASANFC
jgi:drug/metabolite transporter (DMT)-like permease